MEKMRCLCWMIGVTLAPIGCATPDLERLRTSLLETDRQWVRAAHGNDADAIARFWTDDAVVYAANREPVVGKKALREFAAKNHSTPGFSISWDVTESVIADSGELAYTLGPYQITAPSAGGGLATHKGHHICVWRRANGDWRCTLEVHAPLP